MRIAILADDFTGSAEVGAVALRYGLSSELQERYEADSTADVIVLNTDSRSLPPRRAAAVVAEQAQPLRDRAEWLYKKVDSVLRGPIVAEIEAVLDALHLERALLAPANPSLGRTVRGGHYFIHDVPLDQTAFAAGGEHPATTSDVLAVLGKATIPVAMLTRGESLPPRGIFVGQAASSADLAALARQVDPQTLPVGGAEFLAAVLAVKGYTPVEPPRRPPAGEGSRLWVCGSAPACAAETVERARARGVSVLSMPQELLAKDSAVPGAMQAWADQACAALGQAKAAVVSIGTGRDRGGEAEVLTRRLAELAAEVLGRGGVGRLYIEGGATAAAVAQRMGWHRFTVLGEWAGGVVSLRVFGGDGPMVTIKPGSYPWPEEIWP